MTLISANLDRSGPTGRFPYNSAREYHVVFDCLSDALADGPATVLAGFTSLTGIAVGASYAIGNDSDPQAICTEIYPTRPFVNQLLRWRVAVKYDNQWQFDSSGKGKKPDGTPSDNPLEWRDEMQIQSAQVMVPIEKAELIFEENGQPGNGYQGPISNSSWERFDPPPEEPRVRRLITIVQNRAQYPAQHAADYDQAINDDQFTVSKSYLGYSETFKKHTVLMNQIGASSLFHNSIAYWKLTWELHFDSDTWLEQYVDRGLPTARVGDKKPGTDQTFTAADFKGQGPFTYAPIDFKGDRMGPQLLDGNGQMLYKFDASGVITNPNAAAKYATWLSVRRRKKAFGLLGL